MSQDLLTEFDSFYQPPKPVRPPSVPTSSPPKPFSPAYQNAARIGNRYRSNTSSTTFDDLLGIMDTGLHSNPRPAAAVNNTAPARGPRTSFARRPSDDPYSSGLFDIAPQRGTSTSDLYAQEVIKGGGARVGAIAVTDERHSGRRARRVLEASW